jgi:quinoprotein glucose dehydrogenase
MMRGIAASRPIRVLTSLVAALAAVCLIAAAQARAAPVRADGGPQISVIARGLTVPWDIAFLPDGRALVTERPGRVRIVTADGRLLPTPAATISVTGGGEGGLLGVAIDPQFSAAQPFVYLSLDASGQYQVQRWRLSGNTLSYDGTPLNGVPADASVHVSSRVRFGPDGALYTGTGDDRVGSRAQEAGSLNGRILRIPAGQFRGGPQAPEVYAMGLRHPQGLAWQPGTGQLFATDHGASGFDGASGNDELNAIVPGGNYGWPLARGIDPGGFIGPVRLWVSTIAPADIAFITQPGSTWTGHALVTALFGKQLRLLTFAGTRVTDDQPLYANQYGRLRAVTEAPDGSIWVSTSNRDGRGTPVADDDRILRIVPPASAGGGGAAPAPGNPARRPAACPRPATAKAKAKAKAKADRPGPLARRVAKSQRVAQLALRELRRIEARADGRRPPRTCPGAQDAVQATYRQLRITYRISVSALKLHAALSARLLGRHVAVPAPRLTLAGSSRTPATPRQVQRTERIAQAALRRATALAKAVRRR